LVDTGAALTILPLEIADTLKLMSIHQRVRMWSYRREDAPTEADVYYVRLVFPNGVDVPTRAILGERQNVLIGRSALLRTRLEINWPQNFWTLTQQSA
jgi:predicted aspartyl protease